MNVTFSHAITVSKPSIFTAETENTEKATRVFNDIIFAGSLYGLYALATGDSGLLACASYISMAYIARKIASTLIGYMAYPAAFTSFNSTEIYDRYAKLQIDQLTVNGFQVKNVTLCKSGVKYDALAITFKPQIDNDNWVIHALGNGMMYEAMITELAQENYKNNCNTLLVNGPSVCSSGGWPTRYQMGAGFEAGIQFLEKEIKATRIIMRGLSLGGGMMAEAILNHNFINSKKDIKYLFISDRTFSRLSAIAEELVGGICKPVFYITETELDGIAAARKLSDLNIRHIIIQHTDGLTDGVIPDKVSLAYEMEKDSTLSNKIYIKSPYISHNGGLPLKIQEDLDKHIKHFLADS